MDLQTDVRMIDTIFPDLLPSVKSLLITRLDRFYDGLAQCGPGLDFACVDPADLVRFFLFSDFAADCLAKDPVILHDLAASGDLETAHDPGWYQERAAHKTDGAGADQLQHILMDFKRREIIRIAWRDLTGKADLTQTLSDLSHLAKACISCALDGLYEKLCTTHGTPMDSGHHPMQMIVLGMGKLGARELNFSSDIDLIFVYPKEGNTYLDGRMKT
ncbi:MAG: bifunctional [glutamate--ammonia ligase]-adenylyl-L-tyrosine phosphorylase/[glutamate--ammonia-ligase] adenylyltransferase, partial [Desulfobacteraceae bacterium]|nr:bifunctional [glutamate--ammonia ligase]-adenylyl-L-tyrosine phosphorylase/[glutamate--ammonia-ligase] adenylyltransferase [Desulfobacteraceae bacterium]